MLERISLLHSAQRRPWASTQRVALMSLPLLVCLLLAVVFEIIGGSGAGDALYRWAHVVELIALAGLFGLGIAGVLTCRENDRARNLERQLRAEAAREARRSGATYDHLTELPNGRALVAMLKDAIDGSRGTTLAFYLLDLDGFGSVNSVYGSATGDAVLCVVALRLRSVARHGDLIARFEGDTFAVLARDVESRRDAIDIGQRYVASLDDPIAINNRAHAIGVTVGLACYPEDGETPEKLLHHAELAVQSEKARQRSEMAFFVALASAPAV